MMFARVFQSEREFKNLMETSGHGQKAICVGGKHHVAWCFPTLVTAVDCLDLPVVDNFGISTDDNSVLHDLVSSEEPFLQKKMMTVLIRQKNQAMVCFLRIKNTKKRSLNLC